MHEAHIAFSAEFLLTGSSNYRAVSAGVKVRLVCFILSSPLTRHTVIPSPAPTPMPLALVFTWRQGLPGKNAAYRTHLILRSRDGVHNSFV